MGYARLTRLGIPDKRGSRHKFVTCRSCYNRRLSWQVFKNPHGFDKYRLVDEVGVPHSCKIPAEEKPIIPTETKMVSDISSEELHKLATELRTSFDTKIVEEVGKLAVSAMGVAKSTAELIATSAAELAAEKKFKELVPVEHFIKVQSPLGVVTKIEARPHKNLDLMVQVLNQRMHVMMVGPAGGGKTTAAQQAATILGLPYHERSMGPATSEWDLIGYRSPDGVYVPGALRDPFENGGLLALDELDNSNPSVLTVLNSALANGHCSFPDKMVKKHENFVLVGAGNTFGRGADRLYVGRNQLDAATLDRFVTINWDYDEDAEIDWAGRDQLPWILKVQAIRHKAFDLQMRVVVSPRASIFGAKLLRAKIDQKQIEEMVLWKGMSKDDRRKLE